MSNQMSNIDAFYCPITGAIMTNPVIATDGYTYEKSAIESWLNIKFISPMTRQPMSVSDLTPNRALKDAIDEYLSNTPNAVVQQPTLVSQQPPKKDVKIEGKVFMDNLNKTKLHVKLSPNIPSTRLPTALLFVLDVSGSMDEIDATKSAEDSNLSRLDLVKHSVKTIINVLNPNDMVGLITFSNNASLKMGFKPMNDHNKKEALKTVDGLHTEGMTNIWDGLRLALDETKKLTEDINVNIILLTDGEPNVNPPRGIIDSLSDKLKTVNIKQSFRINTFGFGYSLDSELLTNISHFGSGTYGYIPDCSMVGTIFVNWVANVLSTYISNSQLEVVINDNSIKLDTVGPIIFDQSRDLLFDIPSLNVPTEIKIRLLSGGQVLNEYIMMGTPAITPDYSVASHVVRYNIIETVNKAVSNYRDNAHLIHNLFIVINDVLPYLPTDQQEIVKNYIYDYEPTDSLKKVFKGGQIKEAFSKSEYFNRWGRHYLRSLMNAYEFQQCNNFKDPGVQLFAGNLFNTIRSKADEIFCNMPAPVPSRPSRYNYGSGINGIVAASAPVRRCSASASRSMTSFLSNVMPASASASVVAASAPVQMVNFYNSNNTCFDGESMVKVPGGSIKAKMLTKGMDVWTVNKHNVPMVTKVLCVVKTKTQNNECAMCDINGMYITPYHPIKLYGKWVFPETVANVYVNNIDYVYNVVLESGHILTINDVKVCTMGHDFNDNDVIAHPYFGSNKVVDDLKKCEGWNNGLVTFYNLQIERTNGYISRMYEGC